MWGHERGLEVAKNALSRNSQNLKKNSQNKNRLIQLYPMWFRSSDLNIWPQNPC